MVRRRMHLRLCDSFGVGCVEGLCATVVAVAHLESEFRICQMCDDVMINIGPGGDTGPPARNTRAARPFRRIYSFATVNSAQSLCTAASRSANALVG